MFQSYMWTIFRLRFLTYRLVVQDVWGIRVGGVQDLIASIVMVPTTEARSCPTHPNAQHIFGWVGYKISLLQ